MSREKKFDVSFGVCTWGVKDIIHFRTEPSLTFDFSCRKYWTIVLQGQFALDKYFAAQMTNIFKLITH